MLNRFVAASLVAGCLPAMASADVLLNDTFEPGQPPFDLSRYTVSNGPPPYIFNGKLQVKMYEGTSLTINMADLEAQIPGSSIHCIHLKYKLLDGEYTIGTTVKFAIQATVNETNLAIEPIVLELNRPFWNRCQYAVTQNGTDQGIVGFWGTPDTNSKCPAVEDITFDWLPDGKYWIEVKGVELDARLIRKPAEEAGLGDPVFVHEDGKITGVTVTVESLGLPVSQPNQGEPPSLTMQIDAVMVDTQHQGAATQAVTMVPNDINRGAFQTVDFTTDQPFLVPGLSTLQMGPEVWIYDFQVLSSTTATALIQVDERARNSGHAIIVENGPHLYISDFLILPPGQVEPTPNVGPAVQVFAPSVVPANTPFKIDSIWDDQDDAFIQGVLVVMELPSTNEVFDGGYFFLDTAGSEPVSKSFLVPVLPPGQYKIAAVVNDGLSAGAMAAALFEVVLCAACPSDLNGDGSTDGADLAVLFGAWGTDGAADINDDGIVDGADLALELGGWGPCIPPPPTSCGDSCAGSCFAAHSAPFCLDAVCCNAVCAQDLFCCQEEWDTICADEAGTLCVASVCGMSNTQDCCIANSLPGCNDETCCETVCVVDPLCCGVQWDGICANEAATLCCVLCGGGACDTSCPPGSEQEDEKSCGLDVNGGCKVTSGGTSSCCFANGGLGCDDPDCQAAVCAVDSFCCTIAWDGICAGEAGSVCAALCPPGSVNYAPITPGIPTCGTFWADGSARDTDWYSFTVLAPTAYVTLTVAANFAPGVVLGFLDNNCPPFTIVLEAQVGCPMSVTACLVEGTYTAFVATNAFAGLPCGDECGLNDYVATVTLGGTCTPLGCGASDNDCCVSSPTGTPFCSDETCCVLVCRIDPFCCTVAWDGICAGEAASQCGICGVAGSNCCVANGGLGCDCASCQDAVCAVDSFCCTLAWDGICAGEAASLCGDLCSGGRCGGGGGVSNCCSANGGLGCDDAACQSTVCAVDTFCCSVAWDGICAGEAMSLCGSLCDP